LNFSQSVPPNRYASEIVIIGWNSKRAKVARTRWLAVCAAGLVVFAASGARAGPPNVLVLLIDALRADHLGCYGYPHPTSRNIDALAAQSVVFDNMFAQSPWTKPSIPSLFTSLYPIQHGVYEGEAHTASGDLESDVLSDDYTTLAEVFQANGYETIGLAHNAHLAADQGFAQGFDRYEQTQMRAPEINGKFIEFLERDREQPFFAYLHYLDVHWPFQPDEPFRSRFAGLRTGSVFDRDSWSGLRSAINKGTITLSGADLAELTSRQDAVIAQLDHQIGLLLDDLRARNLLDQTVVLLTSDHGEELLDHGRVGHGGTLYREVIDIPLMIRLPRMERIGRTSEPARLIDVFPTLLGIAGIEAPPGLEGRNLLAGAGTETEVVAETKHKRIYRVSVRRGDWKYVRTYKAGRSSRHSDAQSGAVGLAVGARVKAKGIFGDDGIMHASKLSLKDAGDDDLELVGAIESIDKPKNIMHVHGFRIFGRDLLTAEGAPLVATLAVGDWVKVEGKPGPKRSIYADKLEKRAPDRHNDEIEGIVVRVDKHSDESVRLRVGNADVIVAKDAPIKQPAANTEKPRLTRELQSELQPEVQQDDPFAPTNLLSSQAPAFTEQLFDIAKDPGEQVDVATGEVEQLALLRSSLETWLQRMSRHEGARADRQSLDASSIEQLRALGYLE
jgi:arylsulfatase A-like enzyme